MVIVKRLNMKTRNTFLLLALPLMALLMTGCPVGLDYPLGTPGKEAINPALLGTWVNNSSESEVQRVKLEKGKDNNYVVSVLERGEMYALETDNLTGWVTSIAEKNFFFAQPEGEEKYYHYCYWMDGGTLITQDVSLLDGGVDAVTSTETLRKQVESSMHMDAWATETQEWTKE